MTVADFQLTLGHLRSMLDDAGAAKPAGELSAVIQCLDKFREQKLKDFCELLARLDLSGALAPKAGRARTASPAKGKPNPAALAEEIGQLYERAAEDTVTESAIRDACARLNPLTIPELKSVASRIDLIVPTKLRSKKDIVAAIEQRIVSRKGGTLRNQALDRPAPLDPPTATHSIP